TEDCEFDHNTLIGNGVQIAVQRSRNNRIHDNLLIGGDVGVLYNDDCRPEDLVNRIEDNTAAGLGDRDTWRGKYGRLL
ncbi:MAG: hypothetical protein J6Q17_06210, partial [Clostridia bacterium]|nr:hypothetical protein [Clostridia bacterium]